MVAVFLFLIAIKYLLFAFNFLFFVGGITILCLFTHIQRNQADYRITDEIVPAINLLVIVGGVTLIFGFLGCCGAIRENRCLLALFFLGLLSMFVMLLAVGALGAITRTEAAQELAKERMRHVLPLSEQPRDVRESFQEVQKNGFCCGLFVGYVDWGNSTVVPDSCNCTDSSRNCTFLRDGRKVYSTPCMTYIMTWMDRVSYSLLGTAIGFGILMILASLTTRNVTVVYGRNWSVLFKSHLVN
uniref:Tetraspanin n=1 Tax=Seriola dumerili TaxID=41447 RepID=A0A3B4UAV9_SERDU